MCIIIVSETERAPSAVIRAGMSQNRDGNGIGWIGPTGRPVWRKGLEPDAIVALAESVPLPFVVHARMATVGAKSRALCHPFPIERDPALDVVGTAESVLFHNGHVSEWRMLLAAVGRRMPKPDSATWSDTRAIAHVLAVAGRNGPDFATELGSGNRLAILDGNGVTRYGTWIQRAGYYLTSDPQSYVGWKYSGGDPDERWSEWTSKKPALPVPLEQTHVLGTDGVWRRKTTEEARTCPHVAPATFPNILPLPASDAGRIVVEALKRRAPKPCIARAVNGVMGPWTRTESGLWIRDDGAHLAKDATGRWIAVPAAPESLDTTAEKLADAIDAARREQEALAERDAQDAFLLREAIERGESKGSETDLDAARAFRAERVRSARESRR